VPVELGGGDRLELGHQGVADGVNGHGISLWSAPGCDSQR
jgi:hypothetical protein